MFTRILLALTMAAGFTYAQGGRGAGEMGGEGVGGGGMGGRGGMGNMGGEGMGGGMPRAQRQSKPELFAEKLKLNKDQKEEAQKILGDTAQKARPIVDQINKGRQAIATALLQKKPDEEVKPLLDAYATVAAQMTALEAEAFGRIYATLKPNQQKNAAQAFDILNGIFMPQMGGGGGRGMGRGRGEGGRK